MLALHRAGRSCSVARCLARPQARWISKGSLPPPRPDTSLSAPLQLRADVEDAQSRGILASTPPDYGSVKTFLHSAIQLLKFYVRGAGVIWERRQVVRQIGQPKTRSDFRFLDLQRRDIEKIGPFLFLALTIEELIPLLVVYAPSFLPSTCTLPAQRMRIRLAQVDSTKQAQLALLPILESGQDPLSPPYTAPLCKLFGLASWGPSFLQTRRLQKHFEFIRKDDGLISQDGVEAVGDIDEALLERGMVVDIYETSAENKRKVLSWWIDEASKNANGAPYHPRIALKFLDMANQSASA
ncbi:hypothetical protein CYLTODRAFT_423034 [Cylindrobasidium torrendii FP15055 ss-10]|uniref:Letm1 RBD domain-containing protein n=1 Tax=Cylindrobasidium torrendii FP15055 ss-10 TaxID=1314674 RepID=A0A0D7B9H3_9AGAR|nr:hypothetical protein CYLTODRAFT_423034 [Cylindrobasidium torrendii FP15055 ss-10]